MEIMKLLILMSIVNSLFGLLPKNFIYKIKGIIGEVKVAMILGFSRRNKAVINDLFFEDEKYGCQIDHVLITKYGVFIIETKNFKGKLCGDETKQYWQHNGRNVYSPVDQNKFHVHMFSQRYNIDKSICHNIVVINNHCKVKVRNKQCTIKMRQLKRRIRKLSKTKCLKTREIRELKEVVVWDKKDNEEGRKAYVKRISTKYSYK